MLVFWISLHGYLAQQVCLSITQIDLSQSSACFYNRLNETWQIRYGIYILDKDQQLSRLSNARFSVLLSVVLISAKIQNGMLQLNIRRTAVFIGSFVYNIDRKLKYYNELTSTEFISVFKMINSSSAFQKLFLHFCVL